MYDQGPVLSTGIPIIKIRSAWEHLVSMIWIPMYDSMFILKCPPWVYPMHIARPAPVIHNYILIYSVVHSTPTKINTALITPVWRGQQWHCYPPSAWFQHINVITTWSSIDGPILLTQFSIQTTIPRTQQIHTWLALHWSTEEQISCPHQSHNQCKEYILWYYVHDLCISNEKLWKTCKPIFHPWSLYDYTNGFSGRLTK